jgi:ABC-2 type transport system ATP-binding protein
VAAKKRIGYLPEESYLYQFLNARETLDYYAKLFELDATTRARRIDELLDMVGLTAVQFRPVREYSKGMQRRIGIAQALINDPELVIFDEPMSGLDPIGRRDVRDLILQLRDEGRTILFSSHILSDAEVLCSRIGILAKGKLVASGTLAELTSSSRHGWEVVASGVSDSLLQRLRDRAGVAATAISEGRYSFDLKTAERPEPFIAELAAAGAALVSVSALRTTLEDVFMERIQ